MPSPTLHALLTAATLVFGTHTPLASAVAQGTPSDETNKGYAFIEVVLPQRAPYVGEPFIVRLRAGVDVDVLEANLVQPFRQPLDVPVQLDHPWFEAASVPNGGPDALGPARAAGAGAPADDTAAAALDVARVALGAELASAARHVERGTDGRRFTVLEFQRTFVADAPGALVVPEARLGFAYALEFRDDLVAGRVALDRHDAFVRGGPQELSVRALPEDGRPFSFTGAVGRFTLAASIGPERIPSGATVQLAVELTSLDPHVAAVEGFSGPRLDRFPGFDVVASRESTNGPTRTFEIELAPTSVGKLSVGPIEFAAYDPVAERYVELATPRLELLVVSPRAGDGDRSTPTQGAGSSRAPEDLHSPFDRDFLLTAGASALILSVVIVLVLALRRRG
jgi:hypothetical protein